MRDARELPSGIVAFAALDDPDVDALLAAHARHGGVRGIRHIVNWHADPARTYTPRDVTQDAAWQRGYSRLAQHGLRSEEHTSELQSLMRISYAVFRLKKKNKTLTTNQIKVHVLKLSSEQHTITKYQNPILTPTQHMQ